MHLSCFLHTRNVKYYFNIQSIDVKYINSAIAFSFNLSVNGTKVLLKIGFFSSKQLKTTILIK